MQPQQQRNKFLLIIGTIAFVGLILLLWFLLSGRAGRVSVEIFVVPSDAKVTMDGVAVDVTKGRIPIKKGTHTFAASRQYFSSTSQTINTNDLLENKTIYLALYPNTPEGEDFLANNPKEQLRYERIGGGEFNAVTEKLLLKNPITAQLPYETIDYKIDYDVATDKKSIVFLIKLYEPAALTPGSELYKQELGRTKQNALNYLTDNGIDVKSANIITTPDPDKL